MKLRPTGWLVLALAAFYAPTISGQTAPPAILAVDLENLVSYLQDTGDPGKFATSSSRVTPAVPRNFAPFVFVADVVAVNGKPARGTFTAHGTQLVRSPMLTPGNAIADSAGGHIS